MTERIVPGISIALLFLLGPGWPVCAAEIFLSASFEAGTEGFVWSQDAFFETESGRYARGDWLPKSTEGTGALRVRLGNRDAEPVEGMSGGWSHTFDLPRATLDLRIRIVYRMTQAAGFEPDEFAQFMVSLDGKPLAGRGAEYVERLVGDGDGGEARSTGRRAFLSSEGHVEAGRHRLIVGGYANKKTAIDEEVEILVEEVLVTGVPERVCRRDSECDDQNPCTIDRCAAKECRHEGRAGACADGFDYFPAPAPVDP